MKPTIILIFFLTSIHLFSRDINYTIDTIQIKSEILNEDRSIIVYKPQHITDKDSVKIIYFIDGEYSNFRFRSLITRFNDSIPDLIAVGIINTDRKRDLLYVKGANKFLEFITTELKPVIEKGYKVNGRILYGHSFGGGFTLYSLINRPDFFNYYIASSPTPIMDLVKKEYYLEIDSICKHHTTLYFSCGSEDMVQVIKWSVILKDNLAGLTLKKLKWRFEVLKGKNHNNSDLAALINGINELKKCSLPGSSVAFSTDDSALQKLYNRAEFLAKENIIDYGDRKVLKEGAKYVSVWLETQPMGGYMYAKRNMEAAKNNIEIFMDYQRSDGRLPGVIYNRNGIVTPNYAQFQGLYFAMPAFEMYFLLGKDTAYLRRVYKTLSGFDEYLWKTRDSDHNGCLETWCIYDTGEDNCSRFNGFPNAWSFDYPPTKEAAAKLTQEELNTYCKQSAYDSTQEMRVPIESMDVMSYSYSCRFVLSLISEELNNGKEAYWLDKATEVKTKIKDYLWDETRHACFDKDKDNEIMPVLLHNNLRCMYLGSFDQLMADDFIEYHLMNPEEFWTPMPLPSIAANDPYFKNIPGNNWSGQPQALTYQRSIQALENYGHYAELTLLGKKFLDVLKDSLKFTQQFDPFTATINNSKDGYGPGILTTLEFISRFYGVHLTQDIVFWSCLNDTHDYKYSQEWNGLKFTLETKDSVVNCSINDKNVFSFTKGTRVVTDMDGNIIEVTGISTIAERIKLYDQLEYSLLVEPNSIYRMNQKGVFEKYQSFKYFPEI